MTTAMCWSRISAMTSCTCRGVGGIPGLASTYSAQLMLKRRLKYEYSLW